MQREVTFLRVVHPEWIDNDWLRVDHPTLDPLVGGEPTLGWEGDTRLAVYLHQPSTTFVLWRLETDGEYRPLARLPEGASITPESVNQLITNLIRVDQRRGFNPYDDVIDVENERSRHQATDRQAQVNDFADKFHFALTRTHLPGIDVTKRVFPLSGG